MDGGFGDDVGVETVAEVNGVDVVTVGKRVSLRASNPLDPAQSIASACFILDVFPPAPRTLAEAPSPYFIPHTRPRQPPDQTRPHSPFQITVHDSEKHLQEQVDGVNQHRQQIKPRFA